MSCYEFKVNVSLSAKLRDELEKLNLPYVATFKKTNQKYFVGLVDTKNYHSELTQSVPSATFTKIDKITSPIIRRFLADRDHDAQIYNNVLKICISGRKAPVEYLRDWQKKLIEIILQEPDHRRVCWIYDRDGNGGKTTFCKYVYSNFENVKYFNGGNLNDVAYQISKDNEDPYVCLFDLTRSQGNQIDYTAIEAIKNGMIQTNKYRGDFRYLSPCHVLIFSNCLPDLTMLSSDRWWIMILRNGGMDHEIIDKNVVKLLSSWGSKSHQCRDTQ